MITSPLSAEVWELAGSHFDRLATLPPESRNLDTLDLPQSVHRLLEQMLAAHDTTDPQLLDHTVRTMACGLLLGEQATTQDDYRGTIFGSWRAVEEIGRGGMAVVLRGERADGQFEKNVAIKVLPNSGNVLEQSRLLEEIRILARLEHPNIARLIDGGVNDSGSAYLVLEYVQGLPITRFCSQLQLDIRARVQLLTQVVEAVIYAHRHLTVHRDIKPDNILVTDGGQVKLLDFGIAGLVEGNTDTAILPPGLFCSPAYCSPEQIQGKPPDTSQDIFSLGAVLYELLSGQRIRDNHAATMMLFGTAAYTSEPGPPSRHQPTLPQDLDAICMKALAAVPEQRYVSANALLLDMKCWLSGEPVAARGDRFVYRYGKWLRRYWLPTTAAGITALALIIGSGLALWQAREARDQALDAIESRQRAELVREFMIDLFEVSDPDIAEGSIPDTQELLSGGARLAGDAFVNEPLLQAELLYTLARIHRKLGVYETAQGLLDQARNVIRDEHPEIGWLVQLERANLAISSSEFGAAGQILDDLESRYGPDLTADARTRADIARAQALIRSNVPMSEAVALCRAILNRPLIEIGGTSLAILAHSTALGAFLIAGELEAATEVGQQALELIETGHASPSRKLAIFNNLASVKRRIGHIDEAIELRRGALELSRKVFPTPHVQQAYLAGNLGGDLVVAGRLSEARVVLEEASSQFGQIYPTANQKTIAVDNNLAALLSAMESPELALPYLERTLAVLSSELGSEHLQTLIARSNRASTLSRLGRFEEAESEMLDVLGKRQSQLGQMHPSTLVSHEGMTAHYLRAGEAQLAMTHADTALQGWHHNSPDGHPRVISLTAYRAQALVMLGQIEAAADAFEHARRLAAAPGADVTTAYLTSMGFYSDFLIRHDRHNAADVIEAIVADPHLQNSQERPEWHRINARYQQTQRQTSP